MINWDMKKIIDGTVENYFFLKKAKITVMIARSDDHELRVKITDGIITVDHTITHQRLSTYVGVSGIREVTKNAMKEFHNLKKDLANRTWKKYEDAKGEIL